MPRQGGPWTYILTGKIYCGVCGSAYVGGRGGKRYYQYQCTKARSGLCSNKAIRQDAVEQYVLDQIRDKLLTDNQIEKIASMIVAEKHRREAESGEELPALKSKAANLKSKIGKLLDLYLDAGINKDALKEKINPMQDEADGIEAQIAVYESIQNGDGGIESIKKYLQAQKQKLEHADTKAKQGLVDTFVQRVKVYDDHFDLVLTVDSDKDGGGEGS